MARKKRYRNARSYGDNPHIRQKHGERKNVNMQEPWERRTAGFKRTKKGKRKKSKKRKKKGILSSIGL